MKKAREGKDRGTYVCDLRPMGGGLFACFQISQTAVVFFPTGVINISLSSNLRSALILDAFKRDNN